MSKRKASSIEEYKKEVHPKILKRKNFSIEEFEEEDHPIFYHLLNNNEKAVKESLKILEYKNTVNEYGSGILHYAVWSGNNHCIKVIIEKKGDLNIKNFMGETPLMWAVRKLDVDNVEYLLVNGADPTIENYLHENIFTMIGSWIMFPDPEKVEYIEILLNKYI
jgi:ankyrin repeat protein